LLRSAAIALVLAASAALAGGGAGAQDLVGAQTPSHNIFCLASPPGDGEPAAQLRCDIEQTSTRPPPPPKNCPLDWGDAFGLDPTGPGHRLCHGDTVKNPDDPVIAYGRQWRAYGFTCTSQTTGLTCVNRQGHGFSLARAAQRLF
jgi:hypothetical protein